MSAGGTARFAIDAALAVRLVAAQFPHWAHLTVTPVAMGGQDNVTFHLGKELSLRLPRDEAHAHQVEKEALWLPKLAPHLPLAIQTPLALGAPGDDFPWAWSVNQWLPGESASSAAIPDPVTFARDLAGFLKALQQLDASGGPAAGAHNFFRGGPLSTYTRQVSWALRKLGSGVDQVGAAALWESALATRWTGTPVWIHGDVSPGNLLVSEGRLSAVIDFGIMGVGDPACDLVIAWTFLEGEARAVFVDAMAMDRDVWTRARGWALWKALITLAGNVGEDRLAMQVIEAVVGKDA